MEGGFIMSKTELLKSYQEELQRTAKSEKTIKDYLYNVGLFIDFMEESTGEPFQLPILEIQTRDYASHLFNVQRKSVSTTNTRLAAVQIFADFCSVAYQMPRIKVQKKKAVKTKNVEVLSEQDFRKLKYEVYSGARGKGNPMHIAIFELFHYSGIRESELCDLTLDDVIITDRKQYIQVRNGKGDKFREIKLHPNARQPLLDYLKVRPLSDSNKFFIGNRGTLTPSGVYKMINRYGKRAGIVQSVYPHMLRHQCLTEIAKKCETLDDAINLSAIAGHSNFETTSQYYLSNSREKMDSLIDSLE